MNEGPKRSCPRPAMSVIHHPDLRKWPWTKIMILIQRYIHLAIVSILIVTDTVLYSHAGKLIVHNFVTLVFIFVCLCTAIVLCFFLFWLFLLRFSGGDSAIEKCNNTHSDCLKCDIYGLCKKCRKVLIVATGQCAETCPSGYELSWSTSVHQMGHVCSMTGSFI